MSTATCEERITQPDSPKRSRPPGVAPLFRLSGVARRLQTAAGYAHSSRLGKTKNRQQRGTAGYFSRLLSSVPTAKGGQSTQKSSEKKKESVEAKEAQRGKSQVSEAQRYFGSRVCTSPLRSNHNTRRNGISENMKNRG